MSSFLVPCSWSVLVVIGLVFYLSNPFKEKIENGYLWKNIGFVLLPHDYYQLNDSQKIEFWKTANKWRKRRTMRAIIYTPLIWVAGFVIVFVASLVKITPAAAKTATQIPTQATTEAVTPTDWQTPTRTPMPTNTSTPGPTNTATTIPFTQTPRMLYIYQTVVQREVIPVVITQVVNPTAGPTQTPWVITVVVTSTPSPTPTETPTETTTP